ncbi:MAG: hypothetical protein K8S54_14175 [Spirochaetia bacterium]|nr:hypothetical protein [Spirochaetia bacterium]
MVERRRVNNYWWELFARGKPFLPQGRDTNKVGACKISLQPTADSFVFLLGDYIWRFQMINDTAVATPIQGPPGMDSIQQFKTSVWSCNGECLLWPGHLVFVKTGEVRKLTIPPELDIMGISPDLKTAVAEGRNDLDSGILSLMLIDTTTGKASERILNRNQHMWLLDRRKGVEAVALQFKWQRQSGKDQLTYPN